jgi:TetR/AcrR family transcriptional regulator
LLQACLSFDKISLSTDKIRRLNFALAAAMNDAMDRAPRNRPARYDGADHRQRVLAAALDMFAEVGYAAASTRAIAAAAGIEQGHLAYYFPSKMALWRHVIEAFAHDAEDYLRRHLSPCPDDQAADRARQVLPGLLRVFSGNPRLTRVMLQEFSVSSDRHEWLVNDFARPVWDRLAPLFRQLQRQGYLAGTQPEIAYFNMIGATLITFGNTALIMRLTQADTGQDAWVADAIAHILVPILARGPSAGTGAHSTMPSPHRT